jgi:hypothetical protein
VKVQLINTALGLKFAMDERDHKPIGSTAAVPVHHTSKRCDQPRWINLGKLTRRNFPSTRDGSECPRLRIVVLRYRLPDMAADPATRLAH